MGVESTNYISRENAIERILFIADLISNDKYRTLEQNTSEEETDLVAVFLNKSFYANIYLETDMTEYTNTMIEEIIDSSFYRHSMYNNYSINEEN